MNAIKFIVAAAMLAGSASIAAAIYIPPRPVYHAPVFRAAPIYRAPVRVYRPAPVYRPAVRVIRPAPVYRPAVRVVAPVRVYRPAVRVVAPVRVVHPAPMRVVRPARQLHHVVVRHRPIVVGRRTQLPAGIAFNAAHRAGPGLIWARAHVRGPLAFYWHRDGHRWHRWYFPWWLAGQLGWYWYDTPADTADQDEMVADDGSLLNAAGIAIDDSTLPTCDPDSDQCS